MAIRTILTVPDPFLRKKCPPVETIDAALSKLADDMLETMYEAQGIGLSANQVGVAKRMIVVDIGKDGQPDGPLVMVNPELSDPVSDVYSYNEGCLSVPEQYAEIVRPAAVRVSWLDLDGQHQTMVAEGLMAVCIQHEID
ncbi:MAG: peptide deformylase, partial [Pseudomonadota bacterium]